MQYRLQKSAFVAIGLTRAVIIFVTLLPSPHRNNLPVLPDAEHRSVNLEKGQKRQAVPA
jgi:hypothetical protein